ncbi:MAG: DUF5060 domain-containing protein [Planctomycetota bacterium]
MSQTASVRQRLHIETLEPRMLLAGDGITAQYFDTIDLTEPVGTRVDSVVNFPNDSLGNSAQGMVAADDNYSIRWTGWVHVEQSGTWQFTTFSNDGVRLWVDDAQLINNWNQHPSVRDDGQIQLDAGWHPIRMEYFQQEGTTDARLLYSGPGQSETIIPQSNLSTTDPNAGDPVVSAGPDRVVLLPETSVVLDGSATDDGVITNLQWVQISGPNSAMLSGANTDDLTASSLVEGTYTFRLSATDDELNTSTDTVVVQVAPDTGGGVVTGEIKQWHKVTIDFAGPSTSESAAVNPFTDYRLDVTFTHQGSGESFVVPGYFAADGNAANSSATSGNVWRVHFAPNLTGDWVYSASFRSGTNVAMSDAANAGVSAGFFDGAIGSFEVAATDKIGRDFRGKGRLEYTGERYLKFAGSGEYFLKQGADSPENLLAYDEFDGPFTSDGQGDSFIKNWAPHVSDWSPGDPTWGSDKGKGLIGAINYLASEGMNAFSFLPMNIAGDDRNVFPYLNYNERLRMDVSRLAQWEVVFEHADKLGMFLHFKTQETENDQLLDGGALGNQRKLYYRELIARFSHHLALNWNLGEENTNTSQQVKDFAQYFRDNDPYGHHIVLHTFPGGQQDVVYDPLLGSASELTGASLQTNNSDFSQVHSDTARWVNDSAAAGKPWAVAVDEPGDPQHALRPDNDAGNSHVDGRKNALWGTLMAGGWGNEYYFGYGHAHSDLTLQDFRSRDDWWDYARYALEFFEENEIPFWQMQNDNSISTAASDYGLYNQGDTYVVYLKNGGTTDLDLTTVGGTFDVRWFDPRNGGELEIGTTSTVSGGGFRNLGNAPNSTTQDWTILVRRRSSTGPNQPPEVSIASITPVESSVGGVFLEQNGLVVIEMESQTAADGWQLQTSVPGFTGDGYFRWEGPDLFGSPGVQGVTEYKFTVTSPGTYQMRFRNHRNSGIPFDQENDIWAKMDNGSWIKVFSGIQGEWNWASNFDFGEGNRPAASYQLSAGEHTFTIAGRSNGFRVDRVVFYDPSLTSAGQALNPNTPQSPVQGETSDLAFELEGIALDDGQLLLSPEVQWSLTSGPGSADFSSPQNNNTQVEFSRPGTYVVSFTATDGEFQATASRTIVAPVVEAPLAEMVFEPIDDATVEGATGINDGLIKVQQSGPARTGYFKFDVDGTSGDDVQRALLRLVVTQDPGSGTLSLYQGTSNAWAEETISSANAPGLGTLLDSVSGTHAIGDIIEFDVSSAISGNGTYSFVLKHSSGSDVWFSSKEGNAPPQLIIETGGFADFTLDGVVSGADFLAWQRGNGLTGAYYHEGDANGDGEANATDLEIWQTNYSGGSIGQRLVAASIDQSLLPQNRNQYSPPARAALVDLAVAAEWFEQVAAKSSENDAEVVIADASTLDAVFDGADDTLQQLSPAERSADALNSEDREPKSDELQDLYNRLGDTFDVDDL